MHRDEIVREQLMGLLPGRVLFDEPAGRHATIGVGGRVDAVAFPESETELARLAGFLRDRGIPFLPVGRWSNLIVRDGGYRGVLVSLTGICRLELGKNGDGGVLVRADAGASLAELVGLSVQESLSGVEFCAGIPGSVGGAIRMNAGAYGGEIQQVVTLVRLLDPAGRFRTATRDTLDFSYRNLDLPAETIIIGAVFRLTPGEKTAIAGRVREILERRRAGHPLEFPNAGSIFKNPRTAPAGKLIEQAGLRGIRIGDAQVSEKHGNFIVNRGEATAGEVLRLIALIQKRVFEETGEALETEVKIIGE